MDGIDDAGWATPEEICPGFWPELMQPFATLSESGVGPVFTLAIALFAFGLFARVVGDVVVLFLERTSDLTLEREGLVWIVSGFLVDFLIEVSRLFFLLLELAVAVAVAPLFLALASRL